MIQALYLAEQKVSDQCVDTVKYYINELERTRDATYLLCLYTPETDFYRLLNAAIATKFSASQRAMSKDSFWAMYFAGLSLEIPH